MPTNTPTKLSLASFGRIFGMHPLHLMQVRLGTMTDEYCDHIYFRHEWQTADHVSREEIARAIAEAEDKIEAALGFHLAPTWEVDEWRPGPRNFRHELNNIWSSDMRGLKNTVQANWGYFISGGIQSKTLIQAADAIVWSDTNNDGLDDTGTVVTPTVVVDPNEICIFYPGHDGEDEWEIKPIEVSIAGGNITITFKRELAVISDILDLYDVTVENSAAVYEDDADFLTTVDVYRRYNDPQTQASFLWEPWANGWCASCGGTGCSTCAYSVQSGCLIVRGDPRQSIVGYSPASWDSDDNVFDNESWTVQRQPDIVRLYYYSGFRDKRQRYVNRMSAYWERIVAHMAAALLDRPPCDCAKGDWSRWRQDITLISGNQDQGVPIYREPGTGLGLGGRSKGLSANSFGSKRGEIDAWLAVQQHKILGAAKV